MDTQRESVFEQFSSFFATFLSHGIERGEER